MFRYYNIHIQIQLKHVQKCSLTAETSILKLVFVFLLKGSFFLSTPVMGFVDLHSDSDADSKLLFMHSDSIIMHTNSKLGQIRKSKSFQGMNCLKIKIENGFNRFKKSELEKEPWLLNTASKLSNIETTNSNAEYCFTIITFLH